MTESRAPRHLLRYLRLLGYLKFRPFLIGPSLLRSLSWLLLQNFGFPSLKSKMTSDQFWPSVSESEEFWLNLTKTSFFANPSPVHSSFLLLSVTLKRCCLFTEVFGFSRFAQFCMFLQVFAHNERMQKTSPFSFGMKRAARSDLVKICAPQFSPENYIVGASK